MQAWQKHIWGLAAALCAGNTAARAQSDIPASEQNIFDPTGYIEYQEFQEAKEKELNRKKLRFKLVERDGISYVKLQSDDGAILVPATQNLNRDALKDARCAEATPIAGDEEVLSKTEYEISKRIKIYSGIILTAITEHCGKTVERTVKANTEVEASLELEAKDVDQRTSIFSDQSLPKAIKGIYDPNLGIRKEN